MIIIVSTLSLKAASTCQSLADQVRCCLRVVSGHHTCHLGLLLEHLDHHTVYLVHFHSRFGWITLLFFFFAVLWIRAEVKESLVSLLRACGHSQVLLLRLEVIWADVVRWLMIIQWHLWIVLGLCHINHMF